MLPDIQALIDGRQEGNQLIQGALPSGSQVGGGQPPIDPLKPLFNDCHRKLMQLSSELHRMQRERHSNMVMKLATQLQSISLDAAKEAAEEAAEGGGAASGVAPLNAMGSPGAY